MRCTTHGHLLQSAAVLGSRQLWSVRLIRSRPCHLPVKCHSSSSSASRPPGPRRGQQQQQDDHRVRLTAAHSGTSHRGPAPTAPAWPGRGLRCKSVPAHLSARPLTEQAVATSQHLVPGEVHIYWLDPKQIPQHLVDGPYLELLTAEERAHVDAAQDASLRRERLLSRVLLRTTLAAYCCDSVGAGDLHFGKGPQGKPEVEAPEEACISRSGLHFNVSHTSGLQGCAVSRGALVGLDIESEGRHTRGDPLRLACRYFSPLEQAQLEALDGGSNAARAHFLRLWTLKEAYVKALGRGIRAAPGLPSFSVSVPPLPPADEGSQSCSSSSSSSSNGNGNALGNGSLFGDSISRSTSVSSDGSSSSHHSIPAADGNGGRPVPATMAAGTVGLPATAPAVQQVSQTAGKIEFVTHVASEQHLSWQFALLRPRGRHTAAVCLQQLPNSSTGNGGPAGGGERRVRDMLSMWWTVPLVGNEALQDYHVLACS